MCRTLDFKEDEMDESKANALALAEAIKLIKQQKQIIAIQRTGVLCAAAVVAITIITNTRAVHKRR